MVQRMKCGRVWASHRELRCRCPERRCEVSGHLQRDCSRFVGRWTLSHCVLEWMRMRVSVLQHWSR